MALITKKNTVKHNAKHIASGANRNVDDANYGDSRLVARLIDLLRREPKAAQTALADELGVSRRTVQRALAVLTANGQIARVGGTRGHWVVRGGRKARRR